MVGGEGEKREGMGGRTDRERREEGEGKKEGERRRGKGGYIGKERG